MSFIDQDISLTAMRDPAHRTLLLNSTEFSHSEIDCRRQHFLGFECVQFCCIDQWRGPSVVYRRVQDKY